MGAPHGTPAERVLRRVNVSADGCWHFEGCLSAGGYGMVRVGGVTSYTHRVVYEATVGEIPEGLQLDHLCRNRACCNPDHLEPVTARENTLRGVGVTAVNARKTHCPHGHPLDGRRGDGYRYCLQCNRERVARYHASAREQVAA